MKSLEKLLKRNMVELDGWPSTEAELDALLLGFEGSTLGLENHDDRIANVLDTIDRHEFKAGFSVVKSQKQETLFELDDDDEGASRQRQCQPQRDYSEIVREAYLEIYEGFSTDRVVVDPDRNCLFIQACWKRGAQATQAFLNRQLLNARKANKIGKIEGVNRYLVPRSKMDDYLFASEVGLRLVQDIQHLKDGRRISLDDILCDPKLGKSFVEIASSLAPGFKPVDYRWAALSVRKALNRKSYLTSEAELPVFNLLGTRDRIRPSKLPDSAGFFWLTSADLSFYIGHSNSIRRQIERLIDSRFEEKILEYRSDSLFEPAPVTFSIANYEGFSPSARDPVKGQLVERYFPRMNAQKTIA